MCGSCIIMPYLSKSLSLCFKVFKAYSTFEIEQAGDIEKARDIIKRGMGDGWMNVEL